jgi:hypothetical protein
MNSFRVILILFGFMTLFISACQHDGCTDPKALNRDRHAKKDDGSCTYSTVTFYARYGVADGVEHVFLTVDGQEVGSIVAANWPDGTDDCSAKGTISYQFKNSRPIQWRAEIITTGKTLNASGSVEPSPDAICIKVNVTP